METDSDVRLARRLKRDISQRGRDIHGVMQQYENHVKPAYDRFIAPTMQYADIIVPRFLHMIFTCIYSTDTVLFKIKKKIYVTIEHVIQKQSILEAIDRHFAFEFKLLVNIV